MGKGAAERLPLMEPPEPGLAPEVDAEDRLPSLKQSKAGAWD